MALLPCIECGHQISEHARWCPSCGFPRAASPSLRMSITGFDLPFGALVSNQVRIALASIPAALIFLVIVGGCSAFGMAVLGAVFHR